MTYLDCPDPKLGDTASVDAIDTIIIPRSRDLGGFNVRRALPSRKRQMVGPFIFFDQMGPAEFTLGEGLDVRPHPHINLATLTYLFDGQVLHRDSLGTEQIIRPGAVNWMTAGKGIVHSERMAEEYKQQGAELFGLQTWVALPKGQEERAPSFHHIDQSALPRLDDSLLRARLVAGQAWGKKSPLKTYTDTLFADVWLEPGAKLPVDADHEERAIYTVNGKATLAGQTFDPGQLVVLRPDTPVVVSNTQDRPIRLVLVGGQSMEGPRYIWWNFVSSDKERIEQAKEEWRQGRFDTVPGDEEEFIALPDK